MKNLFESPEAFEAYAIIDFCYYGLKKINEEMEQPKNGVEIMIDEATGYGKAKTKEWIDASISLLEQIIENKKKVDADYSGDAKMLEEVKGIES